MIELLKLRKKMKSKKPIFIRQDAHKKARVGVGWRSSRGHHSKMREHRKGHRKSISVGYKSPRLVRGLHQTGLKAILVHNKNQILNIDIKTQGIMIANVGLKKKVEIVVEAEKRKIHVLNVKNIKKFLDDVKNLLELRKKQRAERSKKKEKKIEKKVEKKEEKELTEEEKLKQEKAEKDKILTKRE